MQAAAAAGAGPGAWRPAEGRAQGLPWGLASGGDVNLGSDRNKLNVTSRKARASCGVRRQLQCQQICTAAPSPLQQGGEALHSKGFPAATGPQLLRQGGKKGTASQRSGARPPPQRRGPHSRPQSAHPLQETVFVGKIENTPIQQLSFLLFLPDLQAAGTEAPAWHHNSRQSQAPHWRGSDSARRVCTEPADIQPEVPKRSDHLGPALAARARNVYFPFLKIYIDPASLREGSGSLPCCGSRENGFPQ